jgi:hypothetical protein
MIDAGRAKTKENNKNDNLFYQNTFTEKAE